ncbi:MAG TPA: hypothetical protein H9768_08405 [Candidatus Mailhella merdavium]|nr:hypothetical protein [Candidatus Mailhella merdavium]
MSDQEKNRMDVFSIREYRIGNEMKKRWFKVGTAFENRDGSWNIRLEACPLQSRESGLIELHMRPPLTRQDASDGTACPGDFQPQQFEY